MEPTPEPEPDDLTPERLQDEENARYPEHADPDAVRERVGLDRHDEGTPDGPPPPDGRAA